jgi:hypothetical protein
MVVELVLSPDKYGRPPRWYLRRHESKESRIVVTDLFGMKLLRTNYHENQSIDSEVINDVIHHTGTQIWR